jgi:hypothetical protein
MTANISTDPYRDDTPEELRGEAAGWLHANYIPGEPGYCWPNAAIWVYEPHYDVTKLLHLLPGQWLEWFRQEQVDAAADGRDGYYASMLDRPITEAIIVLERDGKGYIWDGWHRTGATITKRLATLRAIVGTAPD